MPTPAPTHPPGPARPTINLRPFGQSRFENVFPYTNATTSTKVPNISVASSTNQQKDTNYRTLSDDEYHPKIERGLCFRCDKKYTPRHQCRYRQLCIMIACEQDTGEDGEEDIAEARELEANLNSSSMVGLDSLKTMKFIGSIGRRQVLILLDSGVTQFRLRPISH